jgi:hypothetical protein
LRPIDILTGEIAVEVTGVVGASPALWLFKGLPLSIYTSACGYSRIKIKIVETEDTKYMTAHFPVLVQAFQLIKKMAGLS